MKTQTQKPTKPTNKKAFEKDKFKRRTALLVSLMEQIKRYSEASLNEILDIEKVERLLDMPELANRDWTQECPEHQATFLEFLNLHISVYAKALKQLEEKGLQMK